jgi:hypothetical protein
MCIHKSAVSRVDVRFKSLRYIVIAATLLESMQELHEHRRMRHRYEHKHQ